MIKTITIFLIVPFLTAGLTTQIMLNKFFSTDLENTVHIKQTNSHEDIYTTFQDMHTRIDNLEKSFVEAIDFVKSLNFEPKNPVLTSLLVARGNFSRHDKTFDNLTIPSGVTAEIIDARFLGTGLEGFGSSFVQAERLYQINALFLASLALLESGNGTSDIFRDKNNAFGMGARDGSAYKNAIHFTSIEEGILHTAGHLSHNYLTPGGKYYNGVSIDKVNIRYASDKEWASKIIRVAKNF